MWKKLKNLSHTTTIPINQFIIFFHILLIMARGIFYDIIFWNLFYNHEPLKRALEWIIFTQAIDGRSYDYITAISWRDSWIIILYSWFSSLIHIRKSFRPVTRFPELIFWFIELQPQEEEDDWFLHVTVHLSLVLFSFHS